MRRAITCTPQHMYYWHGQIKEDIIYGTCDRYGVRRNESRLLMGKTECKRPPGTPRRKWADNIDIDLTEKSLEIVDWIYLAEDRIKRPAVVNSITNIPVQ